MATQPVIRTRLNLGVNLRGLTGGVNMVPGQAQDSVDMLPREDGAMFSHWGWLRRNATALAGDIVGIQTFTYKGKNTGAGNVREGNYGVADDAALGQFSRRQALYTGCIVLTTTTFYFWRPDTLVFEIQAIPALPAGIVVDVSPKPSFVVVNDNVYIFGWANQNLRYDPTDRALYRIGWDNMPTVIVPAFANLAAGGTLAAAPYQYATAWINMYTGEVSSMGTPITMTPAGANLSVNFTAGAFANYAGNRHWIGVGDDDDVGIVIYRTAPYGGAFYFLDIIEPELLVTGALLDDGLATAKGEKALRSVVVDEPRFNAADLFKDIIFAISLDQSYSNIRFNSWGGANSYHERWSALDTKSIPIREGEALTAVSHTENNLLVTSQQRGFLGTVMMSSSGRVIPRFRPLAWTVGAVGPKAICTAGPWIYFLSERGPYRWREGLSEPQWIGRDLLALFIDPTSGLCKLSEEAKSRSEVAYDQKANVVRWIFACGRATTLNIHLMYWLHDDMPQMEPEAGWFFASAPAQAFAYGSAITGTAPDGSTISPFERASRMIFGDDLGYVNEYEVGHDRGGLVPLVMATGPVTGGNLNAVVTTGILYNIGDGLIGMRLEVVHVDGSIDVRTIVANTVTNINPDAPFSQIPTGGVWYVAGVPSFWRSVPEHFGDPYAHKSVVDVGVKLVSMQPAAGIEELELSLQAGDYPVDYNKTEQVDLALYHDKTMGSATGRFFQVEVANSRPDEFIAITSYAYWVKGDSTREADA